MKKEGDYEELTLPILVITALIFLFLIIPYMTNPTLYTSQLDSSTELHERLSALDQISREQSGTILPLMQETLSSSGTVILNLDYQDFESAERDMNVYLANSRQMDNLIVRLDMSQSELDDWRRLNAENRADIIDLFDDIRRFSELQRLEIEYRDENDPEMLYSVLYEGEVLRSQIKQTTESYQARSQQVTEVSKRFDINTDSYQQSISRAQSIAQSVEIEQNQRSQIIRATAPRQSPIGLTLTHQPDEVMYGDTLIISGQVTGGVANQVSIYINNIQRSVLRPSGDGTYLFEYQIQDIREGLHTIHATTNGVFSDVGSFRVIRRPTDLTLSSPGGGVIQGRLLAGELPLVNMPVTVLSGGRVITTFETDYHGEFKGEVDLPHGTHRVVAVFDEPQYPLEPARSNDLAINVGGIHAHGLFHSKIFSLFLITIPFLLLSRLGIRRLFNKRFNQVPLRLRAFHDVRSRYKNYSVVPKAGVSEGYTDVNVGYNPIRSHDTSFIDMHQDNALTGCRTATDTEYPDALRHLFLELAQKAGMADPKTATTGDFRRHQTPDWPNLDWINAYEQVLYGGYIPDESKRLWFEEEYLRIRGDFR